ncbi:hypothetical protein ABK040_003731 [Willaertia magna]
MENLIDGLVERISKLLPFNARTTSNNMGDLRQTASSLIKLSNYRLNEVINGLLHMQSSLDKNFLNTLTSPELMASMTGSSSPSLGLNQTNNTSNSTGSIGSNSPTSFIGNNTSNQTVPTGSTIGNLSLSSLQAIEEELNERYIRSKIIVFQLYLKTLSAAINYERLDLRFDNDHLLMVEADNSSVETDTLGERGVRSLEGEAESEFQQPKELTGEESEESDDNAANSTTTDEETMPSFNEENLPKITDPIAESLLAYIMETLFSLKGPSTSTTSGNVSNDDAKTKGPSQYLKHLAARVLFKLSVLSFEVVFVRVEDFFKKMKSDEVDDKIYQMIEYINFDQNKLTRLISLLNDVQAKLKTKAFVALSGPLRQAIWNWITNYPHQFIKLFKSKTSLPGNPQKLFNVIAERKIKKYSANIWPMQAMVLLLCPEVLSLVIMAIKQGEKPHPQRKKEHKFFENILKALKSQKRDITSDTAVVCFVDYYKASTYLKKNDYIAFRFLNSEVQNALHERLMNVENPVKRNGTDEVDVKLMVDFFVSAYRINQIHVTNYIFPHCFKTRNTIFKLSLAKAMLKLARKNSTSLKWHPTLAHSYKLIAKYVRTMFQELLQQESSLYKKGQLIQPSAQTPPSTETLLALLAVFYAEPRLVLENTSENINGHINEILYFFVGLTNCLEGVSNHQVQSQAFKLLQKLFQPHYITQWCPQDIATGFIDLSSSVISRLCFILLQDKETQGLNVKTILDLVKDVCRASNKFLAFHKDKITEQNLASRKRTQMWESTESTLLVLLCSTDPDTWTTTASVFGDLCDMIDILEGKEKGNGIAQNYGFYRKISNLDELGKTRSDQQKAIRRLLRRVELQTKASLAAFIEVYSRWKDFTRTLEEASSRAKEMIDDAQSVDYTRLKSLWKNYTAFLCSMGGVSLQSTDNLLQSNVTGPNSEEKEQIARMNRGVSTFKKPTNFSMKDDLIKHLMILVTSEVQFISVNVTQTIGTELSPALYGVLFQRLHEVVSSFFGEENYVKITETSTLFVDKAIQIVKSVLEQAKESSEDLAMAKFETLILSFIRYCSQLVLNGETQRIKCKLCILIETMMKSKEYITFNNEMMFRFEALRQIVEWTSEFVNKTNNNNTQNSVDLDFQNLDLLCMRAFAALLKDLALMKVKQDKTLSKEKTDENNKREFIKYFSFLSRYLQRSKTDKDAHAQLREYTILSLGCLLESNINYGLEQFMKMTYLEDQETRSAFLSVLTKVMKQGIQLDEEQNAEPAQKYDRMLNILLEDPNLDLVFLMVSSVSVAEMDELCKALVRLFSEKGKALMLIKRAIDKEIETTSSASTLFRANSSASKMLTAYCNLVGSDYMIKTLSELVKQVINDPGSFEVDEAKIKPGETVEKNGEVLQNTAQLFLDHVFNSLNDIPISIRAICHYLADKVNVKFPSSSEEADKHTPKHVAVGGLLFLRLLNPAIVAPKNSGLVEVTPSGEASRCLLLVTKLLQNVANGVKFERKGGDIKTYKEAYMVPLDSFVVKNLEGARDFFEKVSSPVENDNVEQEIVMDDEVREENFIVVHRFLFNNMEKMQQRIVQLTQQTSSSSSLSKTPTPKSQSLNEEKEENALFISPVTEPKKLSEMLERMQAILSELGKPPEKEAKRMVVAGTSEEFTNGYFKQLVSENKDKDFTIIEERKIFYRSGTSKEGRPVFYFIIQHLATHLSENNVDKEDEKIMYHIFKTLQTCWTKPYDVIIDVTGLKEDTGIQLPHLTQFFKTFPAGGRKNCANVVVYNPNTYLKLHLSKISFVKRKALKKKLNFCVSLKELEEFIERKNIELPASTTDFEKEVETTINPAWILLQRGEKKDAIVKISKKFLCIITLQENILNHETKKIDFIDLLSIYKVNIEENPSNNISEHVSLEYGNNVKIMIKAEKNEQLSMIIRNSIIRQKREALLDDKVTKERNEGIRQQDIPGSLLNMCFLNLESRFPRTRTEAYNLLAALAEQFEFPVTLLETDVICVPHNTGDLVVSLSQQVSKAKPLLSTQFLKEALRGFNKVSPPYKFLCLKYMKPWIKNLSRVYAVAVEAKKHAEHNDENETIATDSNSDPLARTMTGFEAGTQIDRIHEWFPDLVKSTMEFQDIYPAVLSEIWGEISKDGALVEISMTCILNAAHEAGPKSTKKLDILNDLVVTLASGGHALLVVDIIVKQFMNVLDTEVKECSEALEDNAAWAKIIIYSRFLLMLSFQNRIGVLENLPIFFYLIAIMIGRGGIYLRATIRSLTINVIHSLATALVFNNEHKKLMQQHLNNLMNEQFQLMFIGMPLNDAVKDIDPFITPDWEQQQSKKEKPLKFTPITMWQMEVLTHFFLEVFKTCYLVDPELQKKWHKEFTELCRSQVRKCNETLLPRLLAVFGVLVKPGQEAKESLPFIMECLINSYAPQSSSIPNTLNKRVDLKTSTLLCLGQLSYKISPDDPLFKQIFILPFVLLSLCDDSLFPAVIHIFDSVLNAVGSSKEFQRCGSIEEYFNTYCRMNDTITDQIISKIEVTIGVNFKTHFSFALATLLLRGLTNTPTKKKTAQICQTLISLSSKLQTNRMMEMVDEVSTPSQDEEILLSDDRSSSNLTKSDESDFSSNYLYNILGYITALIPSDYSSLSLLLGGENKLFKQEKTFTQTNYGAILFVKYLLTVVDSVDMDPERINSYTVLQEAFEKLPNVFKPVYNEVMSHTIQAYNKAKNSRIAEVTLSLIDIMMQQTDEQSFKQNTQVNTDDLLNQIGFNGFAKLSSFSGMNEKIKNDCILLLGDYVKGVIDQNRN